jgi:hypothetical protein
MNLVALTGAVLLLALGGVCEAKRLALVIGNDDYANVQTLKKAVADAKTYAEVLKDTGFDQVLLRINLPRASMDEAIATFLDEIQPGDVAVFAYSGHGWSDGKQDYILGTDIPRSGSEELLARLSTPLKNGINGVLDDMDRRGASLKIAIIDACRDNPFLADGARGLGLNRGLALIAPPAGTFVVFSAGAGQRALDQLSESDPDPNSVFTRVFAPLLRSKIPLQDAVKAAQKKVVALADGINEKQQPAYYDEVIGSVCLAGDCETPSSDVSAKVPSTDAASGKETATMAASIPKFKGKFTDTDLYNMDFIHFLEQHDGKIVYLDATMDMTLLADPNFVVENQCGFDRFKGLSHWEDYYLHLSGRQIPLPTREDGKNGSIYDEGGDDYKKVAISCKYTLVLDALKNQFEFSHIGTGSNFMPIRGFYEVTVSQRGAYIELKLKEQEAPLTLRLEMAK